MYLLASTLMATQQFSAASDTLSSSQLVMSCADCSSSPENREGDREKSFSCDTVSLQFKTATANTAN